MTRGAFITLEGIDGCGKSTQAERLADLIASLGWTVRLTREPGGTPVGDRIREILLHRGDLRVSPHTELLLMSAARAQHVDEVIKPALDAGEVVVSDRFLDSTTAYQGHGLGIDLSEIAQIHAVAVRGVLPDLTVVIDIDPMEARRRKAQGPGGESAIDRIERREDAFHRRVWDGYHQIARTAPGRVVVVDGRGSVADVHERIVDAVRQHVPRLWRDAGQQKGSES